MPFSFPASSLSHPLPKSQLIVAASLLSAPKPRTHRKNHLRPKLPSKSQTITLTEPQSHLDTAHLILPNQQQQQQPVEEQLTNESQALDPYPNPNFPTFEFSLRSAALAVVQIFVAAAALLFVGGAREYKLKGISDHDVDAGTGGGVVGKEVGGVRDGDEDEKGELDFEMAVLEIREMAKDAREREKKEREKREKESEGVLMGRLGEKRGVKKEVSKRKKKIVVKKGVSVSTKVEGGINNG